MILITLCSINWIMLEDLISSVKKEILIDTDVHSANKITLIDSRYSGNHRITGIGSTTFTLIFPIIRKKIPTIN